MIGLLLATEAEAAPLLARLGASLLTETPFRTYGFAGFGPVGAAPCGRPAFDVPVGPCADTRDQNNSRAATQGRPYERQPRPSGVVIISGMGRHATARAAEYLVADRGAKTVINIGIAGALTAEAEAGRVFVVTHVADGDRLLAGDAHDAHDCPRDAWPHLPGGRLATVTLPVFDDDRRSRLADHADLVDMEGFAVADVCHRHGVPCCLLKGVSDRADGQGKEELLKNLGWVSAALADAAVAGLARLAPPPAGFLGGLARFAKIEHTVFSLPLLLAGAYLGAGLRFPSWRVLGLIALAGVGARALGMAMNRILDRRLDALNRRTADRELPSGRMSPARAYGVAAGSLAVYLAACWGLGPTCLALAPVPAAVLIGYSLLKRATNLCHFGIGLCLALAPLCAFVAASDSIAFTPPVLALALFTFCWMSGYDIIYSIQDMRSDRETGVRSVPASLGSAAAQGVAAGVHLVAVGALVGLWLMLGSRTAAGAALAVSIGAFAASYLPQVPLPVRFFPISAVASVAGALVPLLGALP